MSVIASEAPASAGRRSRSRKIRAILAGGLVLGVGAAITLAAWSDDEYATGTFTAGQFNLQGSAVGAATGYADHNNTTAPNGPAALTFTAPFNNLSPNQTVYSGFWVRLAAGTTTGATVRVAAIANTPGTPTDASANLGWSVYQLAPGATCNAAAVSALTPLHTGATLANATLTGNPITLTQGADATTAGTPTQYCFAVTSGTGLVQSSTATATWQFTATSTS